MRAADLTVNEYSVNKAAEHGGGGIVPSQIYDGDGVSVIADILPKLSVAAVVAESREIAAEYIRKLGKCGISSRFVPLTLCDDTIAANPPAEDVRLIIAYGGEQEADCAKRAGRLFGIPVFVSVTSPAAVTVLDRYCAVWQNNMLVLKEGALPVGAAVSKTVFGRKYLPAAFGGICAAAVGLFDAEAYARATGGEVCVSVREQALDLIYSAVDVAEKLGRGSAELPAKLAGISLRLSQLAQSENSDFVRGACDGCARAAATLFRHESRKIPSRGELAFVFGGVLGGLYREFAGMPGVFMPPPDNNLRAERLSEYFGLDSVTAARTAVSRIKNAGLSMYRVREYGSELADSAAEIVRIYDAAKKCFRRMYSDDGYGLKSMLDSSDVRTVLSLSPDLFPVRGNALTLMREFGFLDRYL